MEGAQPGAHGNPLAPTAQTQTPRGLAGQLNPRGGVPSSTEALHYKGNARERIWGVTRDVGLGGVCETGEEPRGGHGGLRKPHWDQAAAWRSWQSDWGTGLGGLRITLLLPSPRFARCKGAKSRGDGSGWGQACLGSHAPGDASRAAHGPGAAPVLPTSLPGGPPDSPPGATDPAGAACHRPPGVASSFPHRAHTPPLTLPRSRGLRVGPCCASPAATSDRGRIPAQQSQGPRSSQRH